MEKWSESFSPAAAAGNKEITSKQQRDKRAEGNIVHQTRKLFGKQTSIRSSAKFEGWKSLDNGEGGVLCFVLYFVVMVLLTSGPL